MRWLLFAVAFVLLSFVAAQDAADFVQNAGTNATDVDADALAKLVKKEQAEIENDEEEEEEEEEEFDEREPEEEEEEEEEEEYEDDEDANLEPSTIKIVDLPALNDSFYHPENFHKDFEGEIEYLKSQIAITFSKELDVFKRHGLAGKHAILDLGGGPGFLSARLAEAFPESSLTLIDVDPKMIEFATKEHKALIDGGRFKAQVGSALNLTGVADESFDFVVSRYVFQHLPNPQQALKEIKRILKPGGKVLIVDIEGSSQSEVLEPILPKYTLLVSEFQNWRVDENPDFETVGLNLDVWMKDAGFTALRMEAVQVHSRIDINAGLVKLDDFWSLLNPDQFTVVKKLGYVSDKTWDAAVKEFNDLKADPKDFLLLAHAFVWVGQK